MILNLLNSKKHTQQGSINDYPFTLMCHEKVWILLANIFFKIMFKKYPENSNFLKSSGTNTLWNLKYMVYYFLFYLNRVHKF